MWRIEALARNKYCKHKIAGALLQQALLSKSISQKRCMVGNQDHASWVNSAPEWKFSLLLLLHAPFLTFWSKFIHWFWGIFFLLNLPITLNCSETFWVRQKELEENNDQFASALANASMFLTQLLSLLFVYSGNWNYSLYTWRRIISQEVQATGCHIRVCMEFIRVWNKDPNFERITRSKLTWNLVYSFLCVSAKFQPISASFFTFPSHQRIHKTSGQFISVYFSLFSCNLDPYVILVVPYKPLYDTPLPGLPVMISGIRCLLRIFWS